MTESLYSTGHMGTGRIRTDVQLLSNLLVMLAVQKESFQYRTHLRRQAVQLLLHPHNTLLILLIFLFRKVTKQFPDDLFLIPALHLLMTQIINTAVPHTHI